MIYGLNSDDMKHAINISNFWHILLSNTRITMLY